MMMFRRSLHSSLMSLRSRILLSGSSGFRQKPPFGNSKLGATRPLSKLGRIASVDTLASQIRSRMKLRLPNILSGMSRQHREEELKGRSSKKGQDAEQSLLSRATSPQPDGPIAGGSMKSMKDKPNPQDLETPEVSGLKTAGPEGEITAGYLMKKSGKTNGWSRRWFVLNEKTGKLGYTKKQEERNFRGTITLEECTIKEIPAVEKSESSKDKKPNGPDSKGPGLVFKLSCKVPYETVLKAHNSLVLKAERVVDKNEWINKLLKAIQARGGQVGSVSIRQSLSGGSLDMMVRKPTDPEEEIRLMSQEVRGYVEAVLNSLAANFPKDMMVRKPTDPEEEIRLMSQEVRGYVEAVLNSLAANFPKDMMVRKPTDPEEEIRLMSQEVRGYVEAVLNSLAANFPKAVVLCQVEKSKDYMMNQLYSSISAIGNERIESLIQEDQNVKRRRERYQKQSSLHENRAAAASTWSDNGGGTGSFGFRQKPFGATSSFGATRHLSSSASSLPPSEEKAKRQWEKEKILEKLCSPEADLNLILRDHKKKGITKADLFSWAKALDMDCKSQYALKILEWVDQKGFKFSPSQLELYVDILCKIKGVESGTTCFKRLKPDFDQNNTRARNNSPAFWTLMTWMQIEMDMDARPKTRPLILTSTREDMGYSGGQKFGSSTPLSFGGSKSLSSSAFSDYPFAKAVKSVGPK